MTGFHEEDTTPRMGSELESRRGVIIDELEIDSLHRNMPYSDMALAAAAICGTPMGFVSLMEDEWQCVIGQNGLDDVLEGLEDDRIDRDLSICTYTISQGRVLVVEDLERDERFKDHPMVTGDLGLRFYAGVPLLVDDVPVGTLCVIDTEPHVLGPRERGELFGLVHQLELSLEVRGACGPDSNESEVIDRLASMMAASVYSRYSESSEDRYRALTDLETEIENVHRFLRKGTSGLAGLDQRPGDERAGEQSTLSGETTALGNADTATEE